MLKKLEEYGKMIADCPKFRYEEARSLYLQMQGEKDSEKRFELREQLINGTLYVVYEFVKKHGLGNLSTGAYDIDDIINSYNAAWIHELDCGKLLKSESYSQIIYTCIRSKYNYYLSPNVEMFGLADIISDTQFIDLFPDFIKRKNSDPEFNYLKYKELLQEKGYKLSTIEGNSKQQTVYSLLNGIYECLSARAQELLEMPKTTMQILKAFLTNIGFECLKIDGYRIPAEDSIAEADNEMYWEQIRKEIDAVSTEKERSIIEMRYGDKRYSRRRVAKELGCCAPTVQHKEDEICKKISRVLKKHNIK